MVLDESIFSIKGEPISVQSFFQCDDSSIASFQMSEMEEDSSNSASFGEEVADSEE